MSTSPPLIVADRYRLVAPLGQGGMGRVWRATDVVLHREVAIKELVPPPGLTHDERQEMRERSLREARAIARLNNINVVRVFDVLRTDADPWIVMEYVPSRSLQDKLAADGPFPAVRAAEIGLGVLNALRAAHRNGVVHRDVKPGNVLIGSDGRVVLTDFGLATLPGNPDVTRTGLVLGSPAYIAPERARDGTAGPAADLWSLGATLYAAVEGQSPFARPSAIATLAALATENPPPARNAGPLKPVLNGLLRKDPAHRIDAVEAERLLQRAIGRRSKLSFPMSPTMRRPGVGRERTAPPVVPGGGQGAAPVVPGPRPPVSRPQPGASRPQPPAPSRQQPPAASRQHPPGTAAPQPPVTPGHPSPTSRPFFAPGKASVGRPAPETPTRIDGPRLDATRLDTPPVRENQNPSGGTRSRGSTGATTGRDGSPAAPGPTSSSANGALAHGSRGTYGTVQGPQSPARPGRAQPPVPPAQPPADQTRGGSPLSEAEAEARLAAASQQYLAAQEARRAARGLPPSRQRPTADPTTVVHRSPQPPAPATSAGATAPPPRNAAVAPPTEKPQSPTPASPTPVVVPGSQTPPPASHAPVVIPGSQTPPPGSHTPVVPGSQTPPPSDSAATSIVRRPAVPKPDDRTSVVSGAKPPAGTTPDTGAGGPLPDESEAESPAAAPTETPEAVAKAPTDGPVATPPKQADPRSGAAQGPQAAAATQADPGSTVADGPEATSAAKPDAATSKAASARADAVPSKPEDSDGETASPVASIPDKSDSDQDAPAEEPVAVESTKPDVAGAAAKTGATAADAKPQDADAKAQAADAKPQDADAKAQGDSAKAQVAGASADADADAKSEPADADAKGDAGSVVEADARSGSAESAEVAAPEAGNATAGSTAGAAAEKAAAEGAGGAASASASGGAGAKTSGKAARNRKGRGKAAAAKAAADARPTVAEPTPGPDAEPAASEVTPAADAEPAASQVTASTETVAGSAAGSESVPGEPSEQTKPKEKAGPATAGGTTADVTTSGEPNAADAGPADTKAVNAQAATTDAAAGDAHGKDLADDKAGAAPEAKSGEVAAAEAERGEVAAAEAKSDVAGAEATGGEIAAAPAKGAGTSTAAAAKPLTDTDAKLAATQVAAQINEGSAAPAISVPAARKPGATSSVDDDKTRVTTASLANATRSDLTGRDDDDPGASAHTAAGTAVIGVPADRTSDTPSFPRSNRPAWQPMVAPTMRSRGVTIFGTTLTRKQTAIGVAIVAAILLLVGILVPMAFAGDDEEGNGNAQPPAAPTGNPAPGPATGSGDGGQTPGENKPPAAASTPPKTSDKPSAQATVPAGWFVYKGNGFSVTLPKGFRFLKQDGTETYLQDQATYRLLIIDQTDQPKPDPVKDWAEQEADRRGNQYRDYQRIRLVAVDGYFQKAADWEFTYINPSGNPQHAQKRGVIVSSKKAFGISFYTSPKDWDGNKDVLAQIYQGFKPA